MQVRIRNQETGQVVELTYDNTILYVFGNPELNHILVDVGEKSAVFYDQELLDDLHQAGYPTHTHTHNPTWAINRWMLTHPQADVDDELSS